MIIFNKYGSRERLFEMMSGVNKLTLNENSVDNQDILDLIKQIRLDYPDDDKIQTVFINLAKRKGIDFAKNEYNTKHSPDALKTKKQLELKKQRDLIKTNKEKELIDKYKGIILLIQSLIKQNGLYDLIINIFSETRNRELGKMVMNKKYSNIFNSEIKNLTKFTSKYLRTDRNLIPLERVELYQYKPIDGEKYGITLTVESYLNSGGFMGNIDENFMFYRVMLDPNIDDYIFNKAMFSNDKDKYGSELKIKMFEKLNDRYYRRVLSPKEFDKFLYEFIDIFTKSNEFYQEKVVSNLNENDDIDKKSGLIKKFLYFINNELDLNGDLPEITLDNSSTTAQEMKSFGKYTPSDKTLLVVIYNRNIADILRTIAHEIIHHKQHINGELSIESGDTGSDIENQANALAGVLMRKFAKNNSIIFE